VHPVRGDRRSPQTTWLGSCLRQALAAAGIERRVTVHGLRRTFAVLLQDAGAPDSVIRQALGHAQQGVTEQHYLPRRDPVVQSWVDRIQIYRGSQPAELTSSSPSVILAAQPRLLH
jgi:integrase